MGSRVSKEQVKTPHFFFGEIATRNEFNKELIVVFKKLLRDDEYEEWERGHKLMNEMNKDSLLVAETYEKEHIKKYFTCCECPADYEMSIVFERFDNLYKTELAKRQAGPSKMWYKEEELFVIFYDLLAGVKEFQVRGRKFGDIRPSQMVITSSSKKIKMINLYSFPWETTSLDKILDKYDKTTKFYLSPEEIQFLNSPSRNANYPNPKTEAFSLGLSILEAAILQNSEDLYNINPRTINHSLLEKRLIILEQKYPLLKVYVAKLLAFKPEERYSCGQLWSILKNYSEKITQFQRFDQKQTEEGRWLQSFRKSGK